MRAKLSRWLLAVTAACSAHVLAQPTAPPASAASAASAYIVQARGSQSASRIVTSVGGRVTHDLPIIHGVSAMLTPAQAARLRELGTVDLFADTAVVMQDYSEDGYSSANISSANIPNQDAR